MVCIEGEDSFLKLVDMLSGNWYIHAYPRGEEKKLPAINLLVLCEPDDEGAEDEGLDARFGAADAHFECWFAKSDDE